MIWSILAQLFWLGVDVLGVLSQSEQEKTIEVLVQRQQLRIVERKQQQAPNANAFAERWIFSQRSLHRTQTELAHLTGHSR
jgi:hypothetical protein